MLGDLIHSLIDAAANSLHHLPDSLDLPDLPDHPSLDLADSSSSLLDNSHHVVHTVQPHFGADPDSNATYTLPTGDSSVPGSQMMSDGNGNWYKDQYNYNHSIEPVNPNDAKKES